MHVVLYVAHSRTRRPHLAIKKAKSASSFQHQAFRTNCTFHKHVRFWQSGWNEWGGVGWVGGSRERLCRKVQGKTKWKSSTPTAISASSSTFVSWTCQTTGCPCVRVCVGGYTLTCGRTRTRWQWSAGSPNRGEWSPKSRVTSRTVPSYLSPLANFKCQPPLTIGLPLLSHFTLLDTDCSLSPSLCLQISSTPPPTPPRLSLSHARSLALSPSPLHPLPAGLVELSVSLPSWQSDSMPPQLEVSVAFLPLVQACPLCTFTFFLSLFLSRSAERKPIFRCFTSYFNLCHVSPRFPCLSLLSCPHATLTN